MKPDLAIRNPEISEKKAWDEMVSHPLQTWAWGEFREKMGITTDRIGLYKKNKLISAWQITYHKIPHTDLTIGYFPKGPIPNDLMLNTLKDASAKHNAVFIQLEPNIISNTKNNEQLATSYKLKKSHHPLFTKYNFILDLTKSEDELLKNMRPKTRYNIKLAQKHGVVIQEDNSQTAFSEYLRLQNETTTRQKFFAHDDKYHQNMWNIMRNDNLARLFKATFKKEILAAWVIFLFKDTIYYPYGASSRSNREVMAPNLMLWEIAKWGKKNGFKYFDLWGALGPNPDPNDPWYGFHRFKAGYNPQPVEYIGSYDLIIRPVYYQLYKLADNLRWKILRYLKWYGNPANRKIQ